MQVEFITLQQARSGRVSAVGNWVLMDSNHWHIKNVFFSVSELAPNIEPIRSSANHESLQAKLHGRSSRKSDL